MSDDDFPRPIEFVDIRVGDTVESIKIHGGVTITRRLTVSEKTKLRVYTDDGNYAEVGVGVAWMLIHRPEPEPLVPNDYARLGIVTFRDGRRMEGRWCTSVPSPEWVSLICADGVTAFQSFSSAEVVAWEPITVQPDGTTAVPTDALRELSRANGDDEADLGMAATAFLRAWREGGEQR